MQGNDQNNNQIGDQPLVEPVLPFIPKIQNPNSQVSAGGIESGPIRVESPVISADLKLPELEKPAENIERMEVKEPKTPVPVSTQVPVVQSDDKNDKKDDEKEEKKEEKEGYFLHERHFGSMARVVPLPKAVTEEGSTASFKNGVLEVHLKKSTKEQKGKISIE